MTTRESDKARAAEGGEQGRAITRGEEAAVRAAVNAALASLPNVGNGPPSLHWNSLGRLMGINGYRADGNGAGWEWRVERLAAEGIVPGAEGWCWAAAADRVATIRSILLAALAPAPGSEPDRVDWDDLISDLRRGGVDSPGLAEVTAVLRAIGARAEGPGWILDGERQPGEAPPAWLTAAVLAALPCDGTILDHQAIVRALCTPRPGDLRHAFSGDDVTTALDFLVASGEIETDNIHGVRWRRWGVPEGWGWRRSRDDCSDLLCPVGSTGVAWIADANERGFWWAYPSLEKNEQPFASNENGQAVATPAAARQSALRACYERRVFGPRPVAAPVTSTPQGAGMGEQVAIAAAVAAPAPTRAEQVRHALLAVLARGAVEGGSSRVLLALDAEGAPDPTIAEAKQAAREIGASVDGARWALPAMPAGWGWKKWQGALYLVHDTATTPWDDSIASVSPSGVFWRVSERAPDGRIIEQGDAENVEACMAAALAAARRAGLFAARAVAPTVTGDGGPPVLPAVTAQGGEAVVLCRHVPTCDLARSILIDRDTSRIEARLMAWRADILAEARAVELGVQRVTIDGPTLRVYADDGRTVVREERMGDGASPPSPIQVLARMLAHDNVPTEGEACVALDAWALANEERAVRRLYDAARREDEQSAGATIPHATVEASLAQRAYAADAPLLYAVWKASTTARDAYRAEGMSSRFSRSLVALWDLLDAAEREPADLGNTDAAERVADLQRAHDNAVASARKTGAQANALEADLRAMRERAERAERDRDAYLSKALAAEAREGEEHNRRCEAERELAALQAGLDGLRTWATGARAVGR